MASYISEGLLHPASNPTQSGVNRVFSGFLLADGLNFNFGESKFFARFLKYVHVQFSLPTDTAVRNQLCKVFVELKDAVIREFDVCFISLLRERVAYIFTGRQVQDRDVDRFLDQQGYAVHVRRYDCELD